MSDALAAIESLRDPGALEAAGIAATYLIANVLFVPATPLNLACGYLGGFGVGFALAAPMRVLGATISFLLARTVFRSSFVRYVESRPRMRALDNALTRRGRRVVTLLRLSPLLPSSVSSYALGATSVRTRDFILGSALGTLPSTILHVFIGAGLASARDALERDRLTTAEAILLWIGVGSTGVLVWMLARHARRELRLLTAGD